MRMGRGRSNLKSIELGSRFPIELIGGLGFPYGAMWGGRSNPRVEVGSPGRGVCYRHVT